ncbi:MAG: response regulator receiver [Nitrospirae bacterium]|nr:MAG: response regulator receiver [Nitrospirota bacterium]
MSHIVIVNDGAFSQVCAALFELDGHTAEIVAPDAVDLSRRIALGRSCNGGIGLVVMSYPADFSLLEMIRNADVPVIILLDYMQSKFMQDMSHFRNICFMVKPLDFRRFRRLVGQAVSGSFRSSGEILFD